MTLVLDSSVLIAQIIDERGDKPLFDVSERLLVGTVNFSEAADFLARRGHSRAEVYEAVTEIPFELIALDEIVALDAAMMRPLTQQFGLSLGDRCCLALAAQHDAIAVTLDRLWQDAGKLLGIEIGVIA